MAGRGAMMVDAKKKELRMKWGEGIAKMKSGRELGDG